MFNGFPSTQTPTVQWWDYSKTNTGTINIALPNDCAPVQFFATGGSTTTIQITLPPNPAQGKTITFKNERYVANTQSIQINDPFPQALQAPCILGQGGSVTFCYIAQNTLTGTGSANWVIIFGGSGIAPLNYYAASLSGYQNNATGPYAVIAGGYQNTSSGTSSFVGSGSTNTASGNYSLVAGGQSNISSATGSFVGGGLTGTASGNYSFVGAGQSGVASGVNSFVGAGSGCRATGIRSVSVGGQNNLANGDNNSIVGGKDNSTNASYTHQFIGGGSTNISSGGGYSVTGGGEGNTNNSNFGFISGGAYGTTRGIKGNHVFPACVAPIDVVAGVSQSALLVLGTQTTTATATALTTDGGAASTNNQVILPNNSAYVFQGTCIANVTGGSTTSGWEFQGVIKRGANAASTTLVAAVTPTVIAQDALAATWVLAITADTTNGGIRVTVTGVAATTIRWVSRIETTEVTY